MTQKSLSKRKKMASLSIKLISTFTIIILSSLSLISSYSIASNQIQPKKLPFKKIYAFGDSYTDTGNTQSSSGPSSFMHVSSPPYGQTFFHHPTNRYSDGRLVIDFVAQALSLPFLPPYRTSKSDNKSSSSSSDGLNFAVAGSTAIIHSFFVKNNITLNLTPQSLQTQLIWFHNFLVSKGCKGNSTTASSRECKQVFEDALFWVGEIGANDYAYSFGSSVPTKTIQDLSISSLTSFLKALLIKGAKYVVVEGLPPTGCLTLSMDLAPNTDRDSMGCVGSANKQSYIHNIILQTKLTQLKKQFPNALIIYADYWNSYSSVVKNASKYGFKELFKVCCGSGGGFYNFDFLNTCGSPSSASCSNPSQYINWDGVHLTEAMYKAVANSFINGSFCHPSFDYLINMKLRSG